MGQGTFAPGEDDRGPVGSWIVTVEPANGSPFVNLVTFLPGGTLVDSVPALPPAPFALGHGAWRPTGGGSFAFTIVFPDLDDEGALRGRSTIRGTLALDPGGETWVGPYATQVTDAAGAVLESSEGTARGSRIAVEPMP